MGAAALPSLWASITGTTATTAAGAGAAAGAAGAAGGTLAGGMTAAELGTLAASNTFVAPSVGSLATGAAAKGAAAGALKTAGKALATGATGALATGMMTPKIPGATAPPGAATADASAALAKARNRSREAIFGGRRGTLLSSGAAEGFNTGRKKLLGQ